ncbi:MAG: cytidine deaminase [Clostridia bacterium]|nr:cytidine deaminase [Clostridia bacterium]
MEYKELVKIAQETKDKAYAPYSGFKVGAALYTKSGRVYTGINIENATYGATICAERTAVFKAVSDGENSFEAIAIASDSEDYVYPCGICRQVLAEFSGDDLKIICSRKDRQFMVHSLGDLLPHAFRRMVE